MAALTTIEKNKLNNAKTKLAEIAAEGLKIQRLNNDEESLLKEIVNYSFHDHVGKYESRYDKVMRYYYIACGILYNHLSVKQLEYGMPLYPSRYDTLCDNETKF